MWQKCGFIFSAIERLFIPLLLFAIRIFWGVSFAITGWGKLQALPKTAAFFASLHVPAPLFHAYLVGGIEALGGLLLVLGLASRLSSLLLSGVMLTALFLAHDLSSLSHLHDFPTLVQQAPFPYLFAALTILAFGPGPLSLDAILKK